MAEKLEYSVRRHLSVIQAQLELLLGNSEEVSEKRQEALERMQRACYELDTLLDVQGAPDSVRRVSPHPAEKAPETVQRVLVCTHDDALGGVLAEEATRQRSLEIGSVNSVNQAKAAIRDRAIDYLVIDTVWPDCTGVDFLGEVVAGVDALPASALLSLYSDATTPLGLALTGVLSPTAADDCLERAFEPYVSADGSDTVAGFLTDWPGGALEDRLAANPATVVGPPATVTDHLRTTDVTADVVCLDPDTYRGLSPATIGRLRTMAPGRGRPIVLIASTARDPHDREWIPTLGSRRFLHYAPDRISLITCILAQRTTVLPTPPE